jgi:hypothetical protein
LEKCFVLVNYSSVPYDLRHDEEYRRKTGRLLAHRIGQQFTKLGYQSWINKGQSNGVDLKVWDSEDNLIIVAEILNWGLTTKLTYKRKRECADNLSKYKCNKLLIYTAMPN